jgi:hypothetical protein
MDNSIVEISAELGLGLVGPQHTIVPLTAGLYYTSRDPYAIQIAFHVGTDEPVEWTLARDLLEAALHSREGIGDVQAWPSVATGDPDAGEGDAGEGDAAGTRILNIVMTSPFGRAQFEAPAATVASFLHRTYEIVPVGEESLFMDFDAELTELLSQA